MMANRLMVNKQCLVPAQRPMDLSGAQSAGNETTLGRRMLGTGVQVYSDHPDNRTLSGSHYHSLLTNPSHLTPQSSIMIYQAEKHTGELCQSVSLSNTCNYFYNGNTDQPPAWD